VIFIDNASTDRSVAYVRKNFPFVKIFTNHKDLGYAGANNAGASKTIGEYILFLNTDTYMRNNSLTLLVKSFIENGFENTASAPSAFAILR
jgi:GT2 family glycosyltransferase